MGYDQEFLDELTTECEDKAKLWLRPRQARMQARWQGRAINDLLTTKEQPRPVR